MQSYIEADGCIQHLVFPLVVVDKTSPWTGQPWFIATLVSLTGGVVLLALCLCAVVVFIKRNRLNKQTMTDVNNKQSMTSQLTYLLSKLVSDSFKLIIITIQYFFFIPLLVFLDCRSSFLGMMLESQSYVEYAINIVTSSFPSCDLISLSVCKSIISISVFVHN